LKRRISAEENGVAHTQARDETSGTGSNHVLIAQSVGHAKTRLDIAPVDVGVMVWNAAEQAAEIELIRVRLGDAALRRRRKRIARNNHPVVKIFRGSRTGNNTVLVDRAQDETSAAIDRHRFAWIVEPWIKHNHVSPLRVVWNNDRITRTVVDVEFLRGRPGILSESFPHVRSKERVCAMTDFRIGIEQS
jgi:hypothetical protein